MPRHSRALTPAFNRLWAAVAVSNLGDGVMLAARPLLVATLTTDPVAISAAMFAQTLPWLLFGLGVAVPFGLHAVVCAVAALIVLRVRAGHRPSPATTTLRADIADGLRFVWRHSGLRILAICIFVMNFAGVGAFAIWVLYGTQHLGLTDTQYGLFITTGAVGGICGAWTYSRLETRFGLLGRASSVYQLASVGGSLLGGFLAARFGLLTPFWVAGVMVAVMTVLAWRRLADVRAGQPVQQ